MNALDEQRSEIFYTNREGKKEKNRSPRGRPWKWRRQPGGSNRWGRSASRAVWRSTPPSSFQMPSHQKIAYVEPALIVLHLCTPQKRGRRCSAWNCTGIFGSVVDPWHFGTDPYRIRNTDFRIQLWIRIRILLFSSVAFKIPIKKIRFVFQGT